MRRWLSLPLRFLRQPPSRRRLLFEALLYLIWARLILQVLPFRHLTRFFNRYSGKNTVLEIAERERVRREVRWAIERVAAHLPGETVCFPRAIAAQCMCRRRGISATLCYGASTSADNGLQAHVWVVDDTDGVIGHQTAQNYQIIARFPG